MPTLAYGLFTTPADAEHARTIIDTQLTQHRPLRVIEHAHEVHDELLPKLGPRVRRDSWIGTLLATLLGAMLGGFVLGGVLGGSPIIAAVLTGMAALTIGLMFTGISRSARARRLIDRLRREVLAGRVLITAEADSEAAAREIVEVFQTTGARETGLLPADGPRTIPAPETNLPASGGADHEHVSCSPTR